ncbi:MAG TPA: hypothetical protein VHA52_00330, partial [Candidatus Babeliaceae bacterium]|nr:hypothetical protein [Candidatus Babeliaceae bacterium]
YADLTLFYNEEKDQYESNGMVVQSVPKAIRESDSSTKGPILGNAFEFSKKNVVSEEMRPEGFQSSSSGSGQQGQTSTQQQATQIDDDLPF